MLMGDLVFFSCVKFFAERKLIRGALLWCLTSSAVRFVVCIIGDTSGACSDVLVCNVVVREMQRKVKIRKSSKTLIFISLAGDD